MSIKVLRKWEDWKLRRRAGRWKGYGYRCWEKAIERIWAGDIMWKRTETSLSVH